MKKLTNIKGITLIALVITIIVLLILAGVTVATLSGENGLLSKAQLAKERNVEAEQDEKDKLSSYEDKIDNYKTWERTGGEGTNVSYCTTPATTTSTASATNPCVVVENYRNGTEWYRVWSDGWIEQGGRINNVSSTSNTTKIYLKEFSDIDYTWIAQPLQTDAWGKSICLMSRKKSEFEYKVGTEGGTWTKTNFYWYACGY